MDGVLDKLKELEERIDVLETKVNINKPNKKENVVQVFHVPKFIEELLRRTGNPDNIKFEIVENLPEDSANPKAWVCPGI